MHQIVDYLRVWACPIKRFVLLDLPIIGFDVAFLVYINAFLAEFNQIVSIVVGLSAASLTIVRIINEFGRRNNGGNKKNESE